MTPPLHPPAPATAPAQTPPAEETYRRFAYGFRSALLSWADKNKPTPDIGCSVDVSPDHGLAVLTFILGDPHDFAFAVDRAAVSHLIMRAVDIEPSAHPHQGDLCVFDRKRILMFRRFNEPLTKRAAFEAAREVAAHILMSPQPAPAGTPARTGRAATREEKP